jgi:hypothetical protein
VLVVEKWLGVLDRSVLGLLDVVLLTDVIVPIDALGEESVRTVMVFRGRSQDGQAGQFPHAALFRITLS